VNRRVTGLLLLLVVFLTGGTRAQDSFHHLHFRVQDTRAAAAWYARYMGGEQIQINNFDAVRQSNGTLLVFSPNNRPGVNGDSFEGDVKGSVGTAVDHVGFSFADLASMMAVYRENGIKILSETKQVGELFSYGFVQDPWGTKIEVMQDSELVGLHHIHLKSQSPATAIQWYQDRFGGKVEAFKNIPGLPAINYGGLWLLVKKSETPLAGTEFRSIDHLGFGVADIDTAITLYKRDGVEIPGKIRPLGKIKIAFIKSPDEVLIEIVGSPEK